MTLGRAKRAARAGATARCCPISSAARTTRGCATTYHGYGGPLGVSYPVNPPPISFAFLRAAQELGIPFNDDFNGAVQDGIGHYQLSTRNAERSSASSAFLRPARAGTNLTVRLNAQTLKIDGRERPRRRRDGRARAGTETLHADREVIFSCGAIGSPRLLQLSGIGPADALKAAGVPVVHDLPGVGSQYAGSSRSLRHLANAPAITPMIAWRGRIAPSGPGCSICCSRPVRSPRRSSRPAVSGTRTRRRVLPTSSSISGSAPASRRASRDEESRRHAELGLPAPALARDGAARQRGPEGCAADRSQLLGRPLRPGMLAQRPQSLRARSCASLHSSRSCWRNGCPETISTQMKSSAEYAYRSCKTDHHPAGTCAMGSGAERRHHAGSQVRGIDGLQGRGRFRDAVRPVQQYERADHHGCGKSVRHDPREATGRPFKPLIASGLC